MKKAFTMVELIFIIVIAGIIAMVALPKFKTSRLFEGRDEIINKLRYTQHLALLDNKFKIDDANWASNNWSFELKAAPKDSTYTIKSGDHEAIDPTNPKFKLKNMLLGKEFGIDIGENTCGDLISFDNQGRASKGLPSSNPYSNIIQGCCTIELIDLSNKKQKAIIEVYGETGYVRYKEGKRKVDSKELPEDEDCNARLEKRP